MELIQRKILLENSTFRGKDENIKWGSMTAQTFSFKIMLTQNIDDMGLFSDIEYIPKSDLASSQPNYTLLIQKLNSLNIGGYPFMTNNPPQIIVSNPTDTELVTLRFPGDISSDYNVIGNYVITGATDSKIEDVKSYTSILNPNPYRAGLDVATGIYTNYAGTSISGVNRIHTMGEPSIYVFDTPTGNTLGTNTQVSGLQYADYTATTRQQVISGDTNTLPLTIFRYISEGWNDTNVSLSALTKEEYLFGIISPPEVQNDVFIDRGTTSVMDMHLRLSEIRNLGQLSEYGNGFYKLNKQ